MNVRAWLVGLAVAAAVSLGFAFYRLSSAPPPPAAPPAPLAAPTIDLGTLTAPAAMAKLLATNRSDGPCKVTVDGSGTFRGSFGCDLAAGESRLVLNVNAPFTVESLTVDRAGKLRRHDMKLTLPGGEPREVVINADDSVEVVPTGK